MDEHNHRPAQPARPNSHNGEEPGDGQARGRPVAGDGGPTGPAGSAAGGPAVPAGFLPPGVASWRPRLPGERLLLPESWLAALGASGEGAGAGGGAGGLPVNACIAYTVERVSPGAPGAARAPSTAAPWPRVLLVPVGADDAAALLAGAGARAPAAARFDGVVLADPADLEGLLARRPDLARPRGGRPCWVLLLFRRDDAPGSWARGWARVIPWSPAALPPVVLPEDLLTGGEPVPADHLWRARQVLLRALEEPVPAPLASRWPGTGGPDHLAGYRETGAPLWWLVP